MTIRPPATRSSRAGDGVSPSRSRRVARVRPSSPGRPSTPMTWSSRAPGTAPRSARRCRTRAWSPSSSTRRSTGRRSRWSPRTTSRAGTSSRASRRTSRSSCRSGARSSTRPSLSPSSRPRTATPSARPGRRSRCGRTALPPVFDPLDSTVVFAHHELLKGDVDAAMAEDGLEVIEATYRVGHQEQLYIENNAIIAVPREDGGMTVHGSLQCPFYVHKALKAGLGLDDAHTQVVQAETGGGFGGKEEYPSMISLHAALLARKTGRPVRMIYDRHEDLSATTKRHPAVIRYRTGIRRDGTIVAQDIDLVMDGGAYTTLTPVVLSRGTIHAGGPYDVAERPHPLARGRHEHAAQRRVPRLRGAPGRVRGGDAGLPGGRGDRDVAAGGPPPQRVPAGRGDADEPAACATTPPRSRSSTGPPRPASTSGSGRGRRPSASREPRGTDARGASGWRWPGTGRASRARARRRWARSRASSAPATAGSGSSRRRRRWARGRRRSFRSWWQPSSGSTSTTWRWRPRTRRSCPIPGRRSPRAPRWWSAAS